MAKKKSIKQSQPKTFWQKARSLKWYVKLLIVIIIGVIGFQIFKASVNKHNVALLDEAEAKMRALEVSESLETRYERRCAFKSVKFQSPGKPRCSVRRIDTHNIKEINQAIAVIDMYTNGLTDYIAGNRYTEEELKRWIKGDFLNPRYDLENYIPKLECGVVFNIDNTSLETEWKLHTVVSCYKDMQFQIYPESY